MSHADHNSYLDCCCTDCKLRYKKYFHWHTWQDLKKLNSKKLIGDKEYYRDAQEEICKKYHVIITLYRTPRQRKFDKIEHYLNLIKSAAKRFKVLLDKQHQSNQKRKRTSRKKNLNDLVNEFSMSEKDYKDITGKTPEQDMSFITGRGKKPDMSMITNKTKKDYSSLTRKNKKQDMSFITGHSKYTGLVGGKKSSFGGKKDYSGLIGKRRKVKI